MTCGTSGVWGTLPTCDASATSQFVINRMSPQNKIPKKDFFSDKIFLQNSSSVQLLSVSPDIIF